MFEIIGIIVIIYSVHVFSDALKTIAKDYEQKINNGWVDYRA